MKSFKNWKNYGLVTEVETGDKNCNILLISHSYLGDFLSAVMKLMEKNGYRGRIYATCNLEEAGKAVKSDNICGIIIFYADDPWSSNVILYDPDRNPDTTYGDDALRGIKYYTSMPPVLLQKECLDKKEFEEFIVKL